MTNYHRYNSVHETQPQSVTLSHVSFRFAQFRISSDKISISLKLNILFIIYFKYIAHIDNLLLYQAAVVILRKYGLFKMDI